MPNHDFQRHSFLGGEVSPSLYERADMEKFGKWFSKAENIRFNETGAFRNRGGFVKVADTKYNLAGEKIKLLSFAFNDEESFLVELGAGYARFYRNGQQIMNGDVPYELQTPLTEFSEQDLKYAQAGDTIFITHPQFGIYELARLQADGSSWEFKKFNTDILPMKEENDDKTKTVSLSSYSQQIKTLSLLNPISSVYTNVVVSFDNSTIYSSDSATITDIYNEVNSAIGESYDVTLSGTNLIIRHKDAGATIPDMSISFSAEGDVDDSVSAAAITGNHYSTATVSYADFNALTSVYVRMRCGDPVQFEGTKNIAANSIVESLALASGYGYYRPVRYGNGRSDGIVYDSNLQTMSYTTERLVDVTNRAWITLYGKKHVSNTYYYTATDASVSSNLYELSSTSQVFDKSQVGDTILVKHAIDTQSLDGSYGVGTTTLGPIRSDGNWRLNTLGNWAGRITIQYSTDNQQSWTDYYNWSSQDSNDSPKNITTSGTLVADDLVWFRVIVSVTSVGAKQLQLAFVANNFTVNSYYKVLFKNSDSSVIVECVKNDVGLFTNNFQWRLPAFSQSEGWPQTVAFYQNRLFFGKDYIIYGSRNNDFWDFYEPIKLQADDPVTMSLLSQKVNTIRNLVTQRSFFTFTAGGEFGIGSEGALTQNDKYLKPFSANGSAFCNPVLISDVVLFVDKSFNSVRALKYSLESDGYEAPDITLTLRALLENERIISTEIIYEEKEALFLSDTGNIWVLKYITDQNVMAWSHWKHAFGKITNICVVPNGAKHDLYIAVEANGHKWIEKLSRTEYMDTVEYFTATEDAKVTVSGIPGSQKAVLQGDKRYFVTIDENNQIDTPDDTTQAFKVGSVYVSTATLLSPVIQMNDYAHANFEVKKPYKVFFYYLNSYGFKIGVEEDEKMEIEWQPIGSDIDDEQNLTSGKKSVLIPSRFDGSARVSFVQEEPFPMEVADVLIQTDYGGK